MATNTQARLYIFEITLELAGVGRSAMSLIDGELYMAMTTPNDRNIRTFSLISLSL